MLDGETEAGHDNVGCANDGRALGLPTSPQLDGRKPRDIPSDVDTKGRTVCRNKSRIIVVGPFRIGPGPPMAPLDLTPRSMPRAASS